MVSRQAQKSPLPARSAQPAMARWKAWECRFGMPGRTGPDRIEALRASDFGVTAVIWPVASTSMRTASAQPSGSRAVGAK